MGSSVKGFWDENQEVLRALMSKVMHSAPSSCFTRLMSKELKTASAQQLIDSFKQLYDCRC